MNYDKPIPNVEIPNISTYPINYNNEDIVSLSKAGFLVDSKYYKQGIIGAYKDVYARKTVVNMLKQAESLLPDNLIFKIYDGYRPWAVQNHLWHFYRQDVVNKMLKENPNLIETELDEDEIDFKTLFFVSKPSKNVKLPALHNTGGAIDLTIVTKVGFHELNMGCLFDDFTNRAWSNHFEESYKDYENFTEVRDNRRLLYNVMIESGFTNLPSEWWHYDYGDKFWAHYTGNIALYEGILDIDLPNRF